METEYKYPYKIELMYLEDEDQEPVYVGYVIITEKHHLEAYPISSSFEDRFVEIVSRLECLDILHIDSPPMDDTEIEPYELFSRIVKKSDNNYIDAVIYNLEHPYGFIQVQK
ncbi:MAG: hypothetical protein B6I30_06800 [Desulfobacteraceae bacterium 4572_187]|nr:MAG: hypothetical protein B6I30_06800 [Desulfobacteraceae bacterium 4572_187]